MIIDYSILFIVQNLSPIEKYIIIYLLFCKKYHFWGRFKTKDHNYLSLSLADNC